MATSQAIPVTIITGYLGSGKTTLLNALLTGAHGRRYAVIVNEFGEIGIDHDLIVGANDDILELSNGCICCTIRGDLLRAVYGLMANRERFDAIVVETTGLAEPGPIAQTFLSDAWLREATIIDGVICVVDAVHGAQTLTDSATAREQAAFADLLLLSKTDIADPGATENLRAALLRINPHAPAGISVRGDTGAEMITGKGAFDLTRLDVVFQGAEGCAVSGHVHDEECGHSDHHPAHDHLDGIGSISLTLDAPVDGQALTDWLDSLIVMRAADIVRAKGIFWVAGEEQRLVFHAVQNHLEGEFQRAWHRDEFRQSRLVFIGRSLDAASLRAGLEACVAQPAILEKCA